MISGITLMYSLRDVTTEVSAINRRPVTHNVRHFASVRSSSGQENGTFTVRLRSPATSSEVYSTVTFTLPEKVHRSSPTSFSRIHSFPVLQIQQGGRHGHWWFHNTCYGRRADKCRGCVCSAHEALDPAQVVGEAIPKKFLKDSKTLYLSPQCLFYLTANR